MSISNNMVREDLRFGVWNDRKMSGKEIELVEEMIEEVSAGDAGGE